MRQDDVNSKLEYRFLQVQSVAKGFSAAPFISSSLSIAVHSFRLEMLNTLAEYKLRQLSATLSLYVVLPPGRSPTNPSSKLYHVRICYTTLDLHTVKACVIVITGFVIFEKLFPPSSICPLSACLLLFFTPSHRVSLIFIIIENRFLSCPRTMNLLSRHCTNQNTIERATSKQRLRILKQG